MAAVCELLLTQVGAEGTCHEGEGDDLKEKDSKRRWAEEEYYINTHIRNMQAKVNSCHRPA